jgi:hypothetical protein
MRLLHNRKKGMGLALDRLLKNSVSLTSTREHRFCTQCFRQASNWFVGGACGVKSGIPRSPFS